MENMNKNYIIIIIITIALTWFCVWFFGNDSDLMNRNKALEKERKELVIERDLLILENDSLKSIEKTIINNYYTTSQKIKSNEKDIKSVNDYVYSLNERSIDSTIRQHTHKPYDPK